MPENTAILLLGSNIQPRENIQKCIRLLENKVQIVDVSSVWKTKAVGSEGPDFLNAALKINTPLLREELKSKVLSDVENQLGRKRTEDKYAPRTIDVDIIIFNKKLASNNDFSYIKEASFETRAEIQKEIPAKIELLDSSIISKEESYPSNLQKKAFHNNSKKPNRTFIRQLHLSIKKTPEQPH